MLILRTLIEHLKTLADYTTHYCRQMDIVTKTEYVTTRNKLLDDAIWILGVRYKASLNDVQNMSFPQENKKLNPNELSKPEFMFSIGIPNGDKKEYTKSFFRAFFMMM